MSIRGLTRLTAILGVMAALFIGAVVANLGSNGDLVIAEASSSDGSEGASHDWSVFV